MNIDNFAIWKFKNVEGVLKNFYAYDFLVSKYQKGFVTFFIHYDLNTDTIVFKSDHARQYNGITCKFSEFHNKLKSLGLFELKDENDCHESATWNNPLYKKEVK